jgi:hypothetical protein
VVEALKGLIGILHLEVVAEAVLLEPGDRKRRA